VLDLSGTRVKIDRAKTHLDDFDRQVKDIKAACRDAVVGKRDENQSEYVFCIERVPTLDPVLSATLGDAIHNLRASLDHLAWQTIIAAGGQPSDNTNFPILDVPPTPDRFGRSRPQIPPGISTKLREILDEMQPYKRTNPATHELFVIHHLDIGDKHRQLLVAIVGVTSLAWFGELKPVAVNVGPYEDGAEICRFLRSNGGDTEDQFQPTISFDVRRNEPIAGGPWSQMLSASHLVRRSLTYIENEVIPRFTDYFRVI
jgi:hypothetical protein